MSERLLHYLTNHHSILLPLQADTFGFTFVGDGATIKRMSLCNVLAMCGDIHPMLVAIYDCSEHMASGGEKDAAYIAEVRK